jgi:hypothetical protein
LPSLSARVNFTSTESFLLKTEMTVLARTLFSEVSFKVPFNVCVCEKAEEAMNNSSNE